MDTCVADAYIILEDDWECIDSVDFVSIIEFMQKNIFIGQVRLRNFKYDGSLTGGSAINFVTQEVIEWEIPSFFIGHHQIRIGNLHWVNNPSIISPSALKILLQEFASEVKCMEAFHKKFPRNAQLFSGIFEHIGQWRIRDDLRQKGYIKDGTKP